MPRVTFTRHLTPRFPDLTDWEIDAGTVADVVAEVDRRRLGFGGLRGHQVLGLLLGVAAGALDPSTTSAGAVTTVRENRLANETSPYLLQHADNPVHWLPWGDEAFEQARADDKPILVSIGYSACHWCHVMEHECFENAEIADLMNRLFVCVKVDREERPDVDEMYMTSVQLMGVSGGWPLNVFVDHDGRPFYGGTYFPPDDRYGRPGWPDVLVRVSEVWKEQPESVARHATDIVKAITEHSSFDAARSLPGDGVFDSAVDALESNFDEKHGGFGGAPKFPPAQTLRFFLRRHARSGESAPLEMVRRTLRAMAHGGIHDQLGGGFHRYSVDERWLVPHFEKMLYDNAQLARVYVEAFQVTGDVEFERVARETLDYVLREMTDPEGGFRSATDADSDGREGIFFVWKRSEVRALLGGDAALFERAYGITENGNFEDVHHPRQAGEEGMNVLSVVVSPAQLASETERPEADIRDALHRARVTLFEARRSRTYPGLDDKILTAWNGLMISSMAYAGRVLDEPRYRDAAVRAAEFVRTRLRDENGGLLRSWRDGQGRIPAFLEDFALFGNACLDVYEATFDPRWFDAARDSFDEMNRRFADPDEGGWFHTPAGDERIARMKSPYDTSLPGANGVAAQLSVRFARLTDDADAYRRAESALRLFTANMERSGPAAMGLLLALDALADASGEVAIVGDLDAPETKALVRVVERAYLPGVVIAHADPAVPGSLADKPLLAGKGLVGGRPAVYICRNYACEAPLTDPDAVAKALAAF